MLGILKVSTVQYLYAVSTPMVKFSKVLYGGYYFKFWFLIIDYNKLSNLGITKTKQPHTFHITEISRK